MSSREQFGCRAAMVLLATLPLAHAVPLSVEPRATIADCAIAAFGVTFLVLRWGESTPATVSLVRWVGPFAELCLVGVLWSHAPGYAGAKALGYAGLGVAALGLARLGSHSVEPLVDAWLLGVALACATVAVTPLLLIGETGTGFVERVLFMGGGVEGLGFPRMRGPYPHPNAFGGVLAVSTALLWARWPAMGGGGPRWLAWMVATGVFVTLVGTASSAWLGVGITLVGWSWLDRAATPTARRSVRTVGFAISAVVLGAALGLWANLGSVRFNGIRPAIWASTFDAIRTAPLSGVGATPVVAAAIDPMVPHAGLVGWDAHNSLLSLSAQFGVLGAALFFGAWLRAGARLLRASRMNAGGLVRIRVGLLLAVLAWAGDGVLAANEDARHGWLLLGLVVAAGRNPQHSGEGEGVK